MNIDLRDPTVVIAGAFNPAIFGVGWIASELFGFDDGASVNATMVADIMQQTQRAYIEKVGVMAEPFRLSIFIDDLEADTIAKAENAVLKTAAALPHTPVAAIGINFKFAVPQPEAAIVDLIKAGDKPEQLGPVRQTEMTSQISVYENIKLNLSRTIADDMLVLKFNYHADLNALSAISGTFSGQINKWYDHAVNSIKALYGLDDELETIKALNT